MSIQYSSTHGDASLWSCIALIKVSTTFLLMLFCWTAYTNLFHMSQFHGYPTRSRTSEETTNTDTSTNCNFAEEILKLRIDLVWNFHDLRDELINMKNIIIKKLQDENAHWRKLLQTYNTKSATNSVEQYDRRNSIEITGIPDNIEDKNLEHSVIEIFKAADIQISHNDVEDCHRIRSPKVTQKRPSWDWWVANIVSRSCITGENSKISMD